MSATEFLQFVKGAYCYISECLHCISDSPNYSSDKGIGRKKFLQIETVEKLFKINYVTKKSNALAICSIEKDIY